MPAHRFLTTFCHLRTAAISLAVALFALCGCADYDDGPESAQPTVTNIVSFMGNNPQGLATFHFYPAGAATPLELTADRPLDSEAADFPCLATYIPLSGDPLASGPVMLLSCSIINDIHAETVPLDRFNAWWDATPLTVRSLWAAGPYINLDCLIPYGEAARDLRFFILEVFDPDSGEELTDLDSYDAFIAHRADTGPTFDRQYYISFDLRDFLDSHPRVSSLRVHVNDAAAASSPAIFVITIPRAAL